MVGPERGEMDCRERRDEINAEEEESSRVRYDVDEVVACFHSPGPLSMGQFQSFFVDTLQGKARALRCTLEARMAWGLTYLLGGDRRRLDHPFRDGGPYSFRLGRAKRDRVITSSRLSSGSG